MKTKKHHITSKKKKHHFPNNTTKQAFNDPNSKRTFYQNQAEGSTQWEHPAMEFYKGVVYMHRGGKEELEALAAKDPPSGQESGPYAKFFRSLVSLRRVSV